MKKVTIYRIVFGVALAVLVVGAATYSLAADEERKLLSGATCLPYNENALFFRAANYYRNDAGYMSTVFCPVERRFASAHEDAYDYVEVGVYDGNDNYTLACWAYSCPYDGDSCDQSTTEDTGAASNTGSYTLHFTDDIDDYYEGYWLVKCNLPAVDVSYSKIYSIHWKPTIGS